MNKKIIICFIMPLILTISLYGLDPHKKLNQYLRHSWSNKNGLPINYVPAITQTKNGYLWIATQEGVVRFDGIKMITYNSNNVPLFKSNMVNCLLEDNYENLWIGTMNGLLRYKDNKFNFFSTKDGLPFNSIRSFAVDKNNSLWVGTDKGVCKYQNGKFLNYSLQDSKHSSFINSIILDSNNDLVLATNDELYKLKNNKFISLDYGKNIKGTISTLYSDKKGKLWIGTINNGLYQCDHNKLIKFINNDKLSGNYISSIIEDTNKSLWVGTKNGGLNRIYDNTISRFTKEDGFPDNTILNLFEDRDHNLWIGTALSGLIRLREGKVVVYGSTEGILSEDVRTVFEDSKNNLWIGCGNAGLYKKDINGISKIKGVDLMSKNVIRSIMESPDNDIWVGTLGSGLFVVENNNVKKFIPGLELPSNQIYSIFRSSNNVMWVGTSSGISKYENGKFTNYTSINNRELNAVRAIAEDNFGAIWVSVEGMGIAKFDKKSMSFCDKNSFLKSNIVTCIYFDKDNIAWIGTYGGGLSWIKDNQVKTITTHNGLANDTVYTIVEDDGKFWISCNNGIFNVKKKDLIKFGEKKLTKISCTIFNESSGLKNRECNGGNYPVAWKDKEGILWFPNVKGLVKIDPKKIKSNDTFPQLLIEKMLVDQKEYSLIKDTVIPPGYKRIEFSYTALAFTNPKNIKFKVRLLGVEKNWVNMGLYRNTYYTLVPPGEYTFEVISTNGEGIWNKKSQKLTFKLQPFFYQTIFFQIFVFLFIVSIISLLVKWRFKALNERKIQLELEVKKRTKEIKLKNIELKKLSIVARETNNGVLIASPKGEIEWLNEGFERMYGYNLTQLIKEKGANVLDLTVKENLKEILEKCVKQKNAVAYESLNKTRDSKDLWTQTELTPIIDDNGEVKQLVFVETDISKLKQAYDQMKEMSLTDPLTHLKNRRYFHNLIDRDVKIEKRKLFNKTKEGFVCSMMFLMVDIDFFKKVNDNYGHKAGDQVLVQVSNRMETTLRASDLLVRWGGEEFLIMTKDDNIDGARLLSKRLLRAIENKKFDLDDGLEISISISIGYCGFPIMQENPDLFIWKDIVNMADSALYLAKSGGRKRAVGINLLNEKMSASNVELIKNQFEKAIENGIIETITSTKEN